MPKYYITLIDLNANQMLVPVKANLNPYNNKTAYCTGMPQFFGGTDDTDQPPAIVLEKEITEESRRTLELISGSPTHFLTSENMFFYWAGENQWKRTGTPWKPASKKEEKEMERIETVDLTEFHRKKIKSNDEEDIIWELRNQTGTLDAPEKGETDFANSSTRTAFIEIISMYLDGELYAI